MKQKQVWSLCMTHYILLQYGEIKKYIFILETFEKTTLLVWPGFPWWSTQTFWPQHLTFKNFRNYFAVCMCWMVHSFFLCQVFCHCFCCFVKFTITSNLCAVIWAANCSFHFQMSQLYNYKSTTTTKSKPFFLWKNSEHYIWWYLDMLAGGMLHLQIL